MSKPPLPEGTPSGTTVVASAIASGGLIGAGLAILSFSLPERWRSTAAAIIPTLSAACSVGVSAIVRELKRRYSKRQWHNDRQEIIRFLEANLPRAEQALASTSNDAEREVLKDGIGRMIRLRALVMTALPLERPWLTDPITAIDLGPTTSKLRRSPPFKRRIDPLGIDRSASSSR